MHTCTCSTFVSEQSPLLELLRLFTQEVNGKEFTLNDSTGVARVITTSVPSGCPTPCSGKSKPVLLKQ